MTPWASQLTCIVVVACLPAILTPVVSAERPAERHELELERLKTNHDADGHGAISLAPGGGLSLKRKAAAESAVSPRSPVLTADRSAGNGVGATGETARSMSMAELKARVPKLQVSDEAEPDGEEKGEEKEVETREDADDQVQNHVEDQDSGDSHEYEPQLLYESYEPYSTRMKSEVMLANVGQDLGNLKWWTKKAGQDADHAEKAVQEWAQTSEQTFKDSLKNTAEVVQGVEEQLKNAHEQITKEVRGSVEAKLQSGGAGQPDQSEDRSEDVRRDDPSVDQEENSEEQEKKKEGEEVTDTGGGRGENGEKGEKGENGEVRAAGALAQRRELPHPAELGQGDTSPLLTSPMSTSPQV